MVYDICIVGAGLWGSSAARHASLPGRKVCLIGPSEPQGNERLGRNIFASYYDAGRNVRKHHGYHPTWSSLTLKTFQSLLELEDTTGIELNTDVGFMLFGKNTDSIMVPSAKTECLPLTTEGVRERYPFLDTSRYGDTAMLFPVDAGHANPRMIVRAQQTAATLQGCDIFDDVVESVRESDDHTHSEPLMRVVTAKGRPLLAKKVLLCTGAFTQFKNLLPPSTKLDLETQGTFVVKLEVGDDDLERLRTMPAMASVDDPACGCYILPPIKYPDEKHYMKIGPMYDHERPLSTLKEIKNWFLSQIDPKLVEKFKDILLNIVKGANSKVGREESYGSTGFTPLSVQTDMCVCTVTPTELPYCDMVSPRLGLAIGGNGFGAMVSDEIGRMAAEMIAGGENWNRDIPREMLKARFMTPSSHL